jgi:hypothetical protein
MRGRVLRQLSDGKEGELSRHVACPEFLESLMVCLALTPPRSLALGAKQSSYEAPDRLTLYK